ncbi:DUF2635 domain-containing protein [Pseudomonas zeae]
MVNAAFFYVYGLGFVVMRESYPLTPALSPRGARGKGSRSSCFSSPEFGSGLSGRRIAQKHLSQSPLPLGEG